MAAIFNGSTSDLSATVSATALQYPILATAWIKPAAATADMTVLALSDNGAGGSLDALAITAAGAVGGDPIQATATAEGSSSSAATSGGFVTGAWQFVAALFTSDASRKVRINDGAWSTPETTSRAVADFTRIAIGSLHNSGATARFNGRLAEVAIWTEFNADFADLTTAQLFQGISPNRIWHQSTPFLYQPLRGAANESTRGGSGESLTASNLLFDESDKPFALWDRSASRNRHLPEFDLAPPYRWPDSGSTPGPLPQNRCVVLDGDARIQLAGASDANWLGVSKRGGGYLTWDSQQVVHRSAGVKVRIDTASGASFTPGSEAFLAADGEVDDSGTVAVGVVTRVSPDATTVDVVAY